MERTGIAVFLNMAIKAAEVVVFGVLHLNQGGSLLLPRWSVASRGQ